ncbi:MAG: M10 family metallopeptidase C-terminal domain-containing protein [Thermoleophilaceae bacterium]|nr:M10 family metallopeptidase C-terminal domain-containing protein [Thermoleophilaceae bacterium]
MNVHSLRTPRGVILTLLTAVLTILAICVFAPTAPAAAKKKVTVTGTYGVPIEETIGSKDGHSHKGRPVVNTARYSYTLRMNPRTTRVLRHGRSYSWKRGKRFFSSRARVTVTGSLKNGSIKVRTIRIAKPSKKAKSSAFSGTYRTAVIPYNFSNDTSTPHTVEGLRQDVFTGANSVQAYWREVSNDVIKFSGADTSNLDGDVFPWVTISSSSTSATCDHVAWGNEALTASGVNAANYDRILFVQPEASACSWDGVADTVNRAWHQMPPSSVPNARIMAHEFGHNFNLNHAGAAPCPVTGSALTLTATMTSVCYDANSAGGSWGTANDYNIMGYDNSSMHHVSAYQKLSMGLLPSSSVASMATPGNYTIYPSVTADAPGAQLLQAPRTYSTFMRNPQMYAEYRKPHGVFENFSSAASSEVPMGVQFSFAPAFDLASDGEIDSSFGWPQMLLDGAPEHETTANLDFDPVKPRESFYDYASSRVYTVLSADGTSATVKTSTPPAPGNQPTVGVSGTELVYNAGTNQHNSLFVRTNAARNALVIVDNATPITAGPGCTAAGELTVSCPFTGFTTFRANLGDLEDSFRQVNSVSKAITVDGGSGADTIDGAKVTASYASRTSGVNLSLDGVANDGAPGETDLLGTSTHGVVGGSGNDTIVGSEANDTIDGGLGSDTIDAAGGEVDLITYASRSSDLAVHLNGQPESGAVAQGEADSLTNFESATGGSGNDTISGSSIPIGDQARLTGGDGNDTMTAGGDHVQSFYGDNGNDTITGTVYPDYIYAGAGDDRIDSGYGAAFDYVADGGGVDTIDYSNRTNGVAIDLANGTATAPGLEDDQLVGIENAIGTPHNDTITGSTAANVLTGGAGADTLNGGLGNDSLRARDAEVDSVTCGDASDTDTASIDATDDPVIGCETTTMAPETTIVSGIAEGASSTSRTQAFTFSSDTAPVTFECSLDSGAWTVCASPYTTPDLSIANHTFSVRAIDIFGGTDATPATRSFSTVLPETTIVSGIAEGASSTKRSQVFTFSSDTAAVTFECSLDSGPWTACASPYTTPVLSIANHTFSVRAIGSLGGTDASPATRSFSIVLPETTIDSGIAEGTSSTTTTQAFTFSSDAAPATFECRLDSGAWNVCTSPYTTPVLSIANHTFAVRAVEQFGGADASPATRSFSIVLPAPDTVISAGPANGSTADDSTATYAFSGLPSAASYQCNVDGAAWAACTSPYTTPTLAVGAHVFNVRAVSAAGVADPSPASRAVSVLFGSHLHKPGPSNTPSTAPLSTDSALGTAIDWIHFKSTSNATVDRKNAAQQISTFRVLGTKGVTTRSDTPKYTWTDAVGTASGSSKVGVATGGAVDSGFQLTIPATNTQTRTLKLYVGMVGSGVKGRLAVNFNGQAAVTDTSVSGSLFSTATRVFTITYRAASASDTLTVEWTQNSSSTSGRAVLYGAGLYNAQEPNTTISSGPAEGATVTTSTASIGFTSTVSGSTFQCKLDQAAWVACTSAWTTPTLPSGLHTVRVRAIGPNGNVDKTSAVRSFMKS